MESGLTLLMVPPDKLVSGGDFPSGGTHADGAKDLILSFYKVTDLCSGQRYVAEVMVALDEFIPEAGVG
jgi:hypothetical protein